jgi:hypothetical protein
MSRYMAPPYPDWLGKGELLSEIKHPLILLTYMTFKWQFVLQIVSYYLYYSTLHEISTQPFQY